MKLQIIIAIFIIALFSSCIGGGKEEAELKLISVRSGNYWGYIDHAGKYLINPQFSRANPFYNGLARVEENVSYKVGYINENGKYVINPTYLYGTDFAYGIALVSKEDSKIEIINTKGETKAILDESIEEVYKYCEGLARFKIGDKYGFIDMEGKIVISPVFSFAEDFSEGFARVSKADPSSVKFGFIDKKGELIIDYQFKNVFDFSEGFASAIDGSKVGFIGTNGKYRISPQFDYAHNFEGDLAGFFQGGLWGYINKKGEIVINPQFKAVNPFFDNYLASVQSVEGKYGFIDKEGKYVINPQFEQATKFYGNIAFISVNNQIGIINKKGEVIVNPQFKSINIDSDYKMSPTRCDYFDVSKITSHLANLITQNSVADMNFETPISAIVSKYRMGSVNFNKYKTELNRFDLTLTEKENISNFAFLVFEIEVNNYDRNPVLNAFRYRIDLKQFQSKRFNAVFSSLETVFNGYYKDIENSRTNNITLKGKSQKINIWSIGTDIIMIRVSKN